MKELWQFELDRAAALDSKRLSMGESYLGEGETYVNWALWLMEQGVTEESVQILAVLRAPLSRWEVESWLNRVIFALGLAAPNPERFRYEYARELARRTVAGGLSPAVGTRALWQEYVRLDYDEQLLTVAYLDDCLEQGEPVEAILQELQAFLDTLPEPSLVEK
ncbi:hypothetical protein [Armatimonas sp.]|uniref:hypothetical protein n=1 Tax=Armatimonas sp. TaxID=1872638 RepID=UPI00286CFB74|nr:hypothetical protein [Armatimonas sp.]